MYFGMWTINNYICMPHFLDYPCSRVLDFSARASSNFITPCIFAFASVKSISLFATAFLTSIMVFLASVTWDWISPYAASSAIFLDARGTVLAVVKWCVMGSFLVGFGLGFCFCFLTLGATGTGLDCLSLCAALVLPDRIFFLPYQNKRYPYNRSF